MHTFESELLNKLYREFSQEIETFREVLKEHKPLHSSKFETTTLENISKII